MKGCCKKYTRRILKDESGMLNYLSLTSPDLEIQREFKKQKLNNFNKIAEMSLGLLLCMTLFGLFNYLNGDKN